MITSGQFGIAAVFSYGRVIFILEVPREFKRCRLLFGTTSSNQQKRIRNSKTPRNNVYYFLFLTVPADSLAPFCAGTSGSTVMITLSYKEPYIYRAGIWRLTTSWRHQMETFSALVAICAGNSPVPGEFPNKGQWRGALMFTLICVWINGWVNNREAGDLRRYRAHYDVTVMLPGMLAHMYYLMPFIMQCIYFGLKYIDAM